MPEFSDAVTVYPAWNDRWSWVPGEDDRQGAIGHYLCEVFVNLQKEGILREFEFCVCWGKVNRIIPRTTKPLVIIHRGDERSVMYNYPSCHAVFREYMRCAFMPTGRMSTGLWGAALERIRDAGARVARSKCKITKLYSIPIGFANPIRAASPPINERQWDISFCGSLSHRPGRMKDRLSLKRIARTRMMDQLKAIESNRTLRILISKTGQFGAADASFIESYQAILSETKFAIAPRGTSLETYRHLEASQAGCIVVTDGIPSVWYMDEHPFIVLRDWTMLEHTVSRLIGQYEELQQLSAKSYAWAQKLEPSNVSAYIIGALCSAKRTHR